MPSSSIKGKSVVIIGGTAGIGLATAQAAAAAGAKVWVAGRSESHIEKAKLYGMQYHFHSPSEHSIDG